MRVWTSPASRPTARGRARLRPAIAPDAGRDRQPPPRAGDRAPSCALLALITQERDREMIRAALPAQTLVHVVAHVGSLRQPWPDGEPTAVLAELADSGGGSLERALAAFHHRKPAVPVCSYIPLQAGAVRDVVRLAARGLVRDVIVAGRDDLQARLHQLLHDGHARSETAALWRVWRSWTPTALRDIVAACIAASGRGARVTDMARRLNRSARTLERQVLEAGLPPARRILGWCRLLRAACRLEQPGAATKVVAADLGYSSPHALVQHLHRYAGLTITELRTAGGFTGLAACVQAELLARRAGARSRRSGARGRRG